MLRDGNDPYGDFRHRIECRHVVFPGIRTSWVPVSFCSYRVQDSAPATDLLCFFKRISPCVVMSTHTKGYHADLCHAAPVAPSRL